MRKATNNARTTTKRTHSDSRVKKQSPFTLHHVHIQLLWVWATTPQQQARPSLAFLTCTSTTTTNPTFASTTEKHTNILTPFTHLLKQEFVSSVYCGRRSFFCRLSFMRLLAVCVFLFGLLSSSFIGLNEIDIT